MSDLLRGRLPAVEHPDFRPAVDPVLAAAPTGALRVLVAAFSCLGSSLHPDDRLALAALASARIRDHGMRAEPTTLDFAAGRLITSTDWSTAEVATDRLMVRAADRTGQLAAAGQTLARLREALEPLRARRLDPHAPPTPSAGP